MKVIKLNTNPNIYSSNNYLVLGTWNKLDDVNAVIDTGSDGYLIEQIKKINTGVGKKPVDKVILTHNHFDHCGGIKPLTEAFTCLVYAFNVFEGVHKQLIDGEIIKLGDSYFEVIHSPGHSSDSICLYCQEERVLFSGDTSLQVYDSNSSYTSEYFNTLLKLSRLKIEIVYPGHGGPLSQNPMDLIKDSLRTIRSSKII